MSILLALLIAFLSTFLLVVNRKEKLAVYLVLFFIPYNIIEIKYIGVNYFLLFGLIIGNIILFLTKKQNWHSNYAYKSYILLIYFTLFIGLIMLIFVNRDYDITVYNNLSKYVSSFLFVIFFVSGILFYKVILRTINNFNDIISYILAFISSSILLFISWINYQFGISVPRILQRRISDGGWRRFSGFWGDYELTNEYLFIVSILSLFVLLNNKVQFNKRIVAFFSFAISLPIAISTGTRSLIIMSLIFIFFMFVVTSFVSKIELKSKLKSIFIIILFLLFTYLTASSGFILSDRLLQTYDIYMSSNSITIESMQLLINRNYTDTYQDILLTGGFWGVGPFFVHFVGNSIYSWMVYHCLYYHIIINFGLFGLIVFLSFYFILLKDLMKTINIVNDSSFLVALLSLFLSLLFDQLKVNYFREPSHMLTYWFIFGVIAAVNKKNIFLTIKSEKKNEFYSS